MKEKMGVRLLGAITITFRDKSVSNFGTSKVRDMLTMLILKRGQSIERVDIINRLWPNNEGANERNRLSVNIYFLKKIIREIGFESDVLIANRTSVAIDPSLLDVDLWRIEEAFAINQSLTDQTNNVGYSAILNDYLGPLAPMVTDSWILPWRREVESIYLETINILRRDAASRGDRAEIHRLLREAINVDPNLILAWEAMASFYFEEESGDQALDAARQIENCYRRKGTTPSARVTAVVTDIYSKYESSSRSNSQYEPTLVACIFDGEDHSELNLCCQEFGLKLGHSGDYVLVPNVVVANELAITVLKRNPKAKVLLHFVIQEVTEPLPRSIRRWPNNGVPGEVFATGAAAAALEESFLDIVRERPALRRTYGVGFK